MIYGEALAESNDEPNASGDEAAESGGIENEIQQELEGIRKPSTANLFTSIKLDVECGKYSLPTRSYCQANVFIVVFFKTKSPVEPVSFVEKIMEDAAADPQRKRTRFTKRLSPMTIMDRASEEGLEKVAAEVLAPHFHTEPKVPKKASQLFELPRPPN